MKPEAADYLAKAREDLGDARQIIQIGLAKSRGAFGLLCGLSCR